MNADPTNAADPMNADRLIDAYVADVVLLLPRKQRRDVAQELRLLLIEEVDAAAAGPDAREQVTRELLTGFGRPAEVAARYGAPVTLIDPADTRPFLTLAIAGSVVILFGAVLNALINQAVPDRDLGAAVNKAWPTVFAWLGVLLVGFAVAAWARRRRPVAPWRPRPMSTDRINRPGRAAAIVFYILGTVVLVDPARMIRDVSGGRAAPAALDAFAYDEGFLRLRGPIVLGLMIVGVLIQAALLWQGRWRAGIHRVDLVFSVVMCAALTWVIGAGPIFRATPTDQATKGSIGLIVLVTLVDLAWRNRRQHVRQAVEAHE